jgi:hypothetical protein
MRLNKSGLSRRKFMISIVLLSIFLNNNAQPDQFRNMPQFLFPEFVKSIVKLKAGGKDLTLLLNYNIVTEKLVFLQKDNVFDLVNPEAVDTATINSRKFIPAGKIFYEVLMVEPVQLFIQHRGSLQDPGKPAAYGGTSQVSSSTQLSRVEMGGQVYNMKLPDELIVKPEMVYWISLKNIKSSFVNERQFVKLFPGKESEIKKYIKQNKLKFESSQDVITLVNFAVK